MPQAIYVIKDCLNLIEKFNLAFNFLSKNLNKKNCELTIPTNLIRLLSSFVSLTVFPKNKYTYMYLLKIVLN